MKSLQGENCQGDRRLGRKNNVLSVLKIRISEDLIKIKQISGKKSCFSISDTVYTDLVHAHSGVNTKDPCTLEFLEKFSDLVHFL